MEELFKKLDEEKPREARIGQLRNTYNPSQLFNFAFSIRLAIFQSKKIHQCHQYHRMDEYRCNYYRNSCADTGIKCIQWI